MPNSQWKLDVNVNEGGILFLNSVQIMVLWNKILCKNGVYMQCVCVFFPTLIRAGFSKGNGNFLTNS